MPLTPVRFPMFSGVVLPAMIILVGCSSPKTAAVPAEKPGPATVEVAVRSDAGKAGVPSDPFVAAVRAGTMSGYSKATIGHAFESAFRDAHWSSRQLKGGTQVVTFTGILPANMRPECGAAKTGTAESPGAQTAKEAAANTAKSKDVSKMTTAEKNAYAKEVNKTAVNPENPSGSTAATSAQQKANTAESKATPKQNTELKTKEGQKELSKELNKKATP